MENDNLNPIKFLDEVVLCHKGFKEVTCLLNLLEEVKSATDHFNSFKLANGSVINIDIRVEFNNEEFVDWGFELFGNTVTNDWSISLTREKLKNGSIDDQLHILNLTVKLFSELITHLANINNLLRKNIKDYGYNIPDWAIKVSILDTDTDIDLFPIITDLKLHPFIADKDINPLSPDLTVMVKRFNPKRTSRAHSINIDSTIYIGIDENLTIMYIDCIRLQRGWEIVELLNPPQISRKGSLKFEQSTIKLNMFEFTVRVIADIKASIIYIFWNEEEPNGEWIELSQKCFALVEGERLNGFCLLLN